MHKLRGLLCLLVLGATAGTAVAGSQGGPTFHAPVTLPGSDGGSEPSLVLSAGGTRLAS